MQEIATRFSLENGTRRLMKHFHSVYMLRRDDALDVTDAEDLADYVLSLTSMAELRALPRAKLLRRIESRMTQGHLLIPKVYGMFLCKDT